MTDSNRAGKRKRYTPEERAALMAEFKESRMSRAEFAAHKGIGISTFHRWFRVQKPRGTRRNAHWREMSLGQVLGTNQWAIEVVSPNGWTIRLQSAFSPPELNSFLSALPC